MPSPPLPPIGAVLGDRYELLRPISWGGMDQVFEADDRVLRRRVAVRVALVATPEEQARFHDEARLLTEQGRPRVYDTGTYGDHAFLVLELADGGIVSDPDATVAMAAVAPGPLGPEPTGDLTAVLPVVGDTGLIPAALAAEPPLRRTGRRRGLPIWAAVAGLAAALVAVLAFAATQRGNGGPAPTSTSVVTSTSTTAPTTTSSVRTTTTTQVTTTSSTTTTSAPTTTTTSPPTTSTTLPTTTSTLSTG